MRSLAYVAYDLCDCLFNQRLMNCVDDRLCGLSTHWNYLPLQYLSADCPFVEEHLWNIIGFDDEGLIPVSHRY